MFHMTLLKFLNNLHKTQPELKYAIFVHNYRRIYDDNFQHQRKKINSLNF
jgi:hypothetical protein